MNECSLFPGWSPVGDQEIYVVTRLFLFVRTLFTHSVRFGSVRREERLQ